MHENGISGSNIVGQTRLEAIASIKKRQLEDLYNVAHCLNETLDRLRGQHPTAKDDEDKVSPCGLIADIERSLQKTDGVISLLTEIERELRSLL